MNRFKFAVVGFSIFAMMALVNCGNEPSNQIGVFADPLCVILQLGQQQQFCAQVTDNLGQTPSQSVTWTVQGGASSGTFLPANTTQVTTTSSTQTVTYQAPSVLPSNCVSAINVNSDQDPSSQNQVSVLLVTDITADPLSCPPPTGPTKCVKGPIAPICPPPLPVP